MSTPTFTTPPPAPSRSTPSTFSTLADAFIGYFATLVAEIDLFITWLNGVISAFSLNSTTATSTTSLAIPTSLPASKSLTVDINKSYMPGMSVKIARTSSPSNWMHGDVTSYDAGTGALVVNVLDILGNGTYTDWTITFSAPTAARAMRNILTNGAFTVNQPGASYVSGTALGAGAYGHDCWKAGADGCNYIFTQLKGPTQITIVSGSLIQIIEDVNVEGGTYILSWAGTAQGRYAINSATPAGAYAASPIIITGQNPGTTMSVELNAGTLGEGHLEPGSVVTPFPFIPYAQELITCQRYCEILGVGGTGNLVVDGIATGPSQIANAIIGFKVTKRVAPTVAISGTWTRGNSGAPVISYIGADGFTIQISSVAAGYFYTYNNAPGMCIVATARL